MKHSFFMFCKLLGRQVALFMSAAALMSSGTSHAQASNENTLVRLSTNVGPIDIRLFLDGAPRTTANFLTYVRSGAYNGSFFHRMVRGFVVQGGGLKWTSSAQTPVGLVSAGPLVTNEFSVLRSNLRGTVAMAKVDGNPDSATNQWFINLADNSANLDVQNGGFTVFGQVLSPSMVIVDTLPALPLINASGCTNLGPVASALAQVPMLAAPANCESITANQLVLVQSAKELPPRHTVADTERIFDYLEAAYPQWFSPSSPVTQQGAGFVYRHYSSTQTYLGIQGGQVFGYAPVRGEQILALGASATWLTQAISFGY